MLEMTDDCCTKIKPEEKTVKNESRSDSDDDSDPEDDAPSKNPLAVLAQGVVPPLKTKSTMEKEEKLKIVRVFSIVFISFIFHS